MYILCLSFDEFVNGMVMNNDARYGYWYESAKKKTIDAFGDCSHWNLIRVVYLAKYINHSIMFHYM